MTVSCPSHADASAMGRKEKKIALRKCRREATAKLRRFRLLAEPTFYHRSGQLGTLLRQAALNMQSLFGG
eukprot:3307100-Amphidinium_carterae.1